MLINYLDFILFRLYLEIIDSPPRALHRPVANSEFRFASRLQEGRSRSAPPNVFVFSFSPISVCVNTAVTYAIMRHRTFYPYVEYILGFF